MSVAFVQKATATGVNAATIAIAFSTANVTAGNTMYATSSNEDSTTGHTITFTDSASNTWATDKQQFVSGSNGNYAAIGSAQITAGGGTKPTVTAHDSGGASVGWQLAIAEFSGSSNTVDVSTGQTAAASTTSITCPSITTTVANGLAIGCFSGDTNVTGTSVTTMTVNGTTATGVLETVSATSPSSIQSAYTLLAAAGAQVAKWTYASDSTGLYSAAFVCYKPAAAGGAVNHFLPLLGVGA